MPSFTKPGRPKSIKAAMRSQRMSSDDPLSVAMAPEEGESPEARVARLAREEEEKRVSDEVRIPSLGFGSREVGSTDPRGMAD